MNLFGGDREQHVRRTPRFAGVGKPERMLPSLKSVSPGFRKRVTQSVKNGNYARMGLRKLFGS